MNFVQPAFRILHTFYQNPKINLRLLLNRYLERNRPNHREEITRTVYGVVRKEMALDHIIRLHNRGRIPTQRILSLYLRMALYLLVYSDTYPAHAVVSTIVSSIPKAFRPKANALLRSLSGQLESIRREVSSHPDLSIRFSISPMLIENLGRISSHIEADLEYLDREPFFHLRPNPTRYNYSEARLALCQAGLTFCEIPLLETFEVKHLEKPIQDLLHNGSFYVQNTASQLVSLIADRYAGSRIHDVAAAPGSKSITLSFMKTQRTLIASDRRLNRIHLMRKNLLALGILSRIHLVVADIMSYPARIAPGDFLLMDLPCTSVGTVRKNPDLKSKVTESGCRERAEAQRRMVQSFLPLPPQTFLLYSVCSFLEGETEDVFSNVKSLNAEPIDISPSLEAFGFSFHRSRHGFYILSSGMNNDFFYIALMKSRG